MAEVAAIGETVPCFGPQLGITVEEARFEAWQAAGGIRPEIDLWQQSQSIVTTTQAARHRAYGWANERSRGRGWPVAVRRSGGGTVFHGSGVLCLSIMTRLADACANVDYAYRSLCDVLLTGLGDLGIDACVGPMPTAPCDGRYNILAGGRKIAGTAARMRFDAAGAAALLHASIIIGDDHAAGVEAVQRFESDLGLVRDYPLGCTTSVSQAGGWADLSRCSDAFRNAFATFQNEDHP